MDTINFWNKLHIHGGKVVLLLSLLFSVEAFSQKDLKPKIDHLPNYDSKRLLHYGFSVAINSATYRIQLAESALNNKDSIIAINPENSLGFTLGFIVNAHLGEYFDFRLLPNVGFYDRNVNYEFTDKVVLDSEIEPLQNNQSTMIELPMLLKAKSRRLRNFRVYTVFGIKPAVEVSSKKKEKRDDQLRVDNSDLSIDYGFGLDVYYPMFKWSPEIRFSHGLSNILIPDQNIFSSNLKKVTTHTVTLYFHFE